MLSSTALIALFGWLPAVVLLFLFLPIRPALLVAVLGGFLFLPQGDLPMPGVLPDFDRSVAVNAAVLFSVALLDLERIARFRPRPADAGVLLLLVCPFASSVANGLGAYDGLASIVSSVLGWGIPYFLGRVYFTDVRGLRRLAVAVFLAGLVYVPFCLYEIRMSPQLHRTLYGFHQHSFRQTHRFGGFRPTVFLVHGLNVGMFMATATLLGVWLWRIRQLPRILVPMAAPLLGVLGVTTVLCRSVGALALLAFGLGLLTLQRTTRRVLPTVIVLSAIPLTYVTLRATGLWTGADLVDLVGRTISADKAGSLQYRLDNEEMLADKALERPLFGWGGWGRSRVRDESGKDVSTTDGRWIIRLGENGIVGLVGLCLYYLGPMWTFVVVKPRGPPRLESALVAGFVVFVGLHFIDDLLNAMPNPVVPIALGGLAGLRRGSIAPPPPESAPTELAADPLLRCAPERLETEARRRWGGAELARREEVAVQVIGEFRPAPPAEVVEALRRIVFCLASDELGSFLALTPSEKVRVVRAVELPREAAGAR